MKEPVAITVGNFDGVHTGHRLVFDELRRHAAQRGLHSAAFTFRNHPLAVVAPERCPVPLQSVEEKAQAIRACGVEPIIVPFTEELRRMSAAAFMTMLKERYGARLLLVGHDNRFGFHSHTITRQEAMAQYQTIGKEIGMEVLSAPELPGVSSSAIRQLLAQGDVAHAAEMLGHPWQWTGKVVPGQQLGRTIGFPTANLAGIDAPPALGPGVYAAVATLPDNTRHPAMVNIGSRPTVTADTASASLSVEAHLIGYTGNLYGLPVTLTFHHRLRAEQRFPTLDALRDALTADRAATLGLLPAQ